MGFLGESSFHSDRTVFITDYKVQQVRDDGTGMSTVFVITATARLGRHFGSLVSIELAQYSPTL